MWMDGGMIVCMRLQYVYLYSCMYASVQETDRFSVSHVSVTDHIVGAVSHVVVFYET